MYRLQLQIYGVWVTMQEFDSREAGRLLKEESELITPGPYRIQKRGGDGQWKTCEK